MREAKERELFEDDPAMSTSLSMQSTSASAPVANTQKIRGKSRTSNGPEGRNGSASTGGRERQLALNVNGVYDPHRHGDLGEWADRQNPSRYAVPVGQSRPPHNGVASILTRLPPPSNGHSTAPSRSGTITPAQSREEPSGSHSPPRHFDSRNSPLVLPQEEAWAGQYTGPASGFLQGPGGPFSRVAQNPGRTIYSQQHRAD
jgi:hypothetical protein